MIHALQYIPRIPSGPVSYGLDTLQLSLDTIQEPTQSVRTVRTDLFCTEIRTCEDIPRGWFDFFILIRFFFVVS